MNPFKLAIYVILVGFLGGTAVVAVGAWMVFLVRLAERSGIL
jgi:hypothetical protein